MSQLPNFATIFLMYLIYNLELRIKYTQIDFSNTGRDGLRLKPT